MDCILGLYERMMNLSLQEYIEGTDTAVKESILSLHDIDIDAYNDGGCNGYVVFGNHKVFRTRVAVKYYYYGESAHEEVSLIKHISNVNVLKVWDAHTIKDGWAYFITDELHNGNIDDLLTSHSIGTHLAIRIIRGILNGVGALHAALNFLLHRDLKPANILLDGNLSPVIADFGSIKRMPENSSEVIASQHSALYRPPESYDHGRYYYTSDIYQIGILLYQLLGGYLPYDISCYMSARQKRIHASITDRCNQSLFEDNVLFEKSAKAKILSWYSLPSYTDTRIVKIIKKATSPEHNNRYLNTADFLLALHKLGSIPEWLRESDVLLCEHNSERYRIVKTHKEKFLVEKCNAAGNWSKWRGSALCDSEEIAIKQLLAQL